MAKRKVLFDKPGRGRCGWIANCSSYPVNTSLFFNQGEERISILIMSFEDHIGHMSLSNVMAKTAAVCLPDIWCQMAMMMLLASGTLYIQFIEPEMLRNSTFDSLTNTFHVLTPIAKYLKGFCTLPEHQNVKASVCSCRVRKMQFAHNVNFYFNQQKQLHSSNLAPTNSPSEWGFSNMAQNLNSDCGLVKAACRTPKFSWRALI